ncbi:hypothetical protein AB0K43_01750 [Kitasatospora sp. NPDC049258]|uniref:hypothetical protein n=1 Tax=Kitasatospora sp. NPDC049258 TaxID=3155394 RepID=UPI00343DAE34
MRSTKCWAGPATLAFLSALATGCTGSGATTATAGTPTQALNTLVVSGTPDVTYAVDRIGCRPGPTGDTTLYVVTKPAEGHEKLTFSVTGTETPNRRVYLSTGTGDKARSGDSRPGQLPGSIARNGETFVLKHVVIDLTPVLDPDAPPEPLMVTGTFVCPSEPWPGQFGDSAGPSAATA